MRLLLLQTSTYLPAFGGAPKANRALFEGLAELGLHGTAIVPATAVHGSKDRQDFLDLLQAHDLEPSFPKPDVIAFELNGVEVRAVLTASRLQQEAEEWIAENRPDWTLVSSEDPTQVLLDAALSQSPDRVIYIAHTTLNLPFGPDGFLRSRRRLEKLRRAAGVITVSHDLQAYLLRWGGLEASVKRFPVYGAGPFDDFADFTRGAVTLVNPCGVKGIDIFCPLAEAFPDFPFAAVPTWGTNAAELERLEKLPNVEVLQPFENVEELFAQTRILLVPSLWREAFGQICIEAMLHGLPVVASNAGGLPEAKLGIDPILPVRSIERYEDTLDERRMPMPIIPEQDLAPWVDALGQLLRERDVYERTSRQSRDAAHRFVKGLNVEPFANFLRQLEPRQGGAAVAEPEAFPAQAAPTAKMDRLSELSPKQRALLRLRLQQKKNQKQEVAQKVLA